MENYLFYDNLVVKVTNPDLDLPISDEMLSALNEKYYKMPTLLVFTETKQLDNLEPIFNEIAVNYIHNEKLFVYLIDGEKANFLNKPGFSKLPEALIIYPTPGYCYSETFSSYTRGKEMTKERLKTWLEAQMNFIIKRYGSLIYSRDYIPTIEYTVVGNGEGDYKIWPNYRDVPAGWEDLYYAGLVSTGSREEAMESARKLRVEYLEKAAFEAENNLKDIDYEEDLRKI